jgi:hypothetical protein
MKTAVPRSRGFFPRKKTLLIRCVAEGGHPQVVKAPGYNTEALSGLKISLGEAFIN